jgi:transcriptional regulator with XRE-family HTH domain
MSKLSQNLRRLMELRGMNQVELSKKSGVDRVLISNYLRESKAGKYPSLQNLLKLAKALNCTLEELTGLDIPAGTIKPSAQELTSKAKRLAKAYDSLPPNDWRRKAIDEILGKSESHDTGGDTENQTK